MRISKMILKKFTNLLKKLTRVLILFLDGKKTERIQLLKPYHQKFLIGLLGLYLELNLMILIADSKLIGEKY